MYKEYILAELVQVTDKEITEKGTEILRLKTAIIRVNGSEMTRDDNLALIELINNSYYSDSTLVDILFPVPMPEANINIIISNNAHGMSMDSIMHYGLRRLLDK